MLNASSFMTNDKGRYLIPCLLLNDCLLEKIFIKKNYCHLKGKNQFLPKSLALAWAAAPADIPDLRSLS